MLYFTTDEEQIVEAALTRWAQQLGITQNELEHRLKPID